MTSRIINLIICAGNFSIFPLFALPSFRRGNYCVRCSGQQPPYGIIFNEIQNLDCPSRQCTIFSVIVRIPFFWDLVSGFGFICYRSALSLIVIVLGLIQFICSTYIAIYGHQNNFDFSTPDRPKFKFSVFSFYGHIFINPYTYRWVFVVGIRVPRSGNEEFHYNLHNLCATVICIIKICTFVHASHH